MHTRHAQKTLPSLVTDSCVNVERVILFFIEVVIWSYVLMHVELVGLSQM